MKEPNSKRKQNDTMRNAVQNKEVLIKSNINRNKKKLMKILETLFRAQLLGIHYPINSKKVPEHAYAEARWKMPTREHSWHFALAATSMRNNDTVHQRIKESIQKRALGVFDFLELQYLKNFYVIFFVFKVCFS